MQRKISKFAFIFALQVSIYMYKFYRVVIKLVIENESGSCNVRSYTRKVKLTYLILIMEGATKMVQFRLRIVLHSFKTMT